MSLREIKELVESVNSAQPRDSKQQVAILDRINAMKALMAKAEQRDMVAFLEAASLLTESLAQAGDLTPERLSRMVVKLLTQVEASFDTGAERMLPSSMGIGGPAEDEADDSTLRMVSDQCLGEILMQTGVISTEEVEEGLRAQRATGVRIGEALVMLGKVNWDQVESAVRLQQKLRSTIETARGISLND
ncbi:MAG: hypothetical protein ACI8TQ_003897 [Planctomycetota bacterium]|jgi:hypothetical protein